MTTHVGVPAELRVHVCSSLYRVLVPQNIPDKVPETLRCVSWSAFFLVRLYKTRGEAALGSELAWIRVEVRVRVRIRVDALW